MFQNNVIPTVRSPVHLGAEQYTQAQRICLVLSSKSYLKVTIPFNEFLNRFRRSEDLIILCYDGSDVE